MIRDQVEPMEAMISVLSKTKEKSDLIPSIAEIVASITETESKLKNTPYKFEEASNLFAQKKGLQAIMKELIEQPSKVNLSELVILLRVADSHAQPPPLSIAVRSR